MDEQSNEPPKKDSPPAMPPPLKPSNVLDSIFHASGPMPPASIGLRGLAFFLDFILLYGFSMLLLVNFGLPANHPSAAFELNQWIDQIWVWAETAQLDKGPPPEAPLSLIEAISYSLNLLFITFWVYFGTCEAFFAGSTIGKRLCCIRTVSTVTLGTVPTITGIVRGGVKTTMIFLIFPLSAPLTLVGLFFNKRRQCIHDLLSRTTVVDERLIKINY
ncbi:MAG: RDD family protein [Lentimonas sp.]